VLGLGAQHASVLGAAPDDGVVHALLDRVFLALFGEGALHPLNILLGEARHVILRLNAEGTDLGYQVLVDNPELLGELVDCLLGLGSSRHAGSHALRIHELSRLLCPRAARAGGSGCIKVSLEASAAFISLSLSRRLRRKER